MQTICRACAIAVLAALARPAAADLAAVERLAAVRAAAVSLLHDKARRALVTAVQDKRFADYFEAAHAAGRPDLKDEIDRISLNLQKHFHVEEMCLITPDGREVSRIVADRIADDLAVDEADAIFFAPGFAAAPREVHVSPVYLSPDADKWVVAYVTPVLVEGEKRAILHYEHGLDVYQRALNRDLAGDGPFLVAIDDEGWILSDSRESLPVGRRGEAAALGDYFRRFDLGGLSIEEVRRRLDRSADAGSGRLVTREGDFDVAYRLVEGWTILAAERAP